MFSRLSSSGSNAGCRARNIRPNFPSNSGDRFVPINPRTGTLCLPGIETFLSFDSVRVFVAFRSTNPSRWRICHRSEIGTLLSWGITLSRRVRFAPISDVDAPIPYRVRPSSWDENHLDFQLGGKECQDIVSRKLKCNRASVSQFKNVISGDALWVLFVQLHSVTFG